MSVQKKNVILEFIQDFYVPKKNQDVVKYVSGKFNYCKPNSSTNTCT